MKKKGKLLIGFIIGIVVISLIVVLIVLFISRKNKDKEIVIPVDSYASYLNNDELDNDFIKEYYSNVKIKIEPPENGNEGEASVAVTLPYLPFILENHSEEFANAKSEEEVQAIIRDHISDYSYVEEVTADVYKDGDEWRLKTTDSIDELIYSNYDELLAAVISQVEWESFNFNIDNIIEQAEGGVENK